MFVNSRRRGKGTLVANFFIALMLLVTFSATSQAYAARSICRTDPVVVLSDGTILEINAAIQTDISNIDHIDYVLHAPSGVKAVTIVYTDILPPINEKVILVNDSPSRTYSWATTIYTRSGEQVNATVNALFNVLTYRTADGVTGQPIVISYTKK
jgi:hypothetical protein